MRKAYFTKQVTLRLEQRKYQFLKTLAEKEKVSMGETVRRIVKDFILQKIDKIKNQEEALKFFANPPKKYRFNLIGKQVVDLIREDRDG